ncbi:DUF4235 domain-containing protein [Streptomyces sp. QTS137]
MEALGRDEDRTWQEVLLAATPQGAIFVDAEAAVDRTGVAGTRRPAGPGR